jgi:predicted nucleic acid-binding protein
LIAIDSSSMIAYLCGDEGTDVDAVEIALQFNQGVFPPVVVSELCSDPTLRAEVRALIHGIPQLEIRSGYWERAGDLRARLLGRGLKARLADALIAQSCLDHDISLLTRDKDFRNFSRHAGLRLD